MKKIIISAFLLTQFSLIFAQTAQSKFIKGNISEKTAAVREANDKEIDWVSTQAIKFVSESYAILGDDRELEGLAVAAILSLPNDYGSNLNESERNAFAQQLITLYSQFNNSSTVRMAILSKYMQIRSFIPTDLLTETLNQDLQANGFITKDIALSKSIVNTLGLIGNNSSFVIIYNYYAEDKLIALENDVEQALVTLIPKSINEINKIIHNKNVNQLTKIFNLINKNYKISQNFLSEIAENLLNETILLMSSSSDKKQNLISIQLGSLKILNDYKCTRASGSVLAYFDIAKNEYNNNSISDEEFIEVISALGNLAPIDSVNTLILYLEELNRNVEKEIKVSVSSSVVTAVINTLGAIGDKSAFDSLLAVTYLNYPDSVLTAAREALSGLKW